MEPQYGALDVNSGDASARLALRRSPLVVVLLCCAVAGAFLFALGQQQAATSAPQQLALLGDDMRGPAESCMAGYEAWVGTPCAPCPAGKHKTAEGDSWCEPCPVGTMSATEGLDAACAGCPAGAFADAAGTDACAAWQECGAGLGVARPGSASADVVCAPCHRGFASRHASATAPCVAMSDADSDGLWDRVPAGWDGGPTDESGERSFDAGDAPMSGGLFDEVRPAPFVARLLRVHARMRARTRLHARTCANDSARSMRTTTRTTTASVAARHRRRNG